MNFPLFLITFVIATAVLVAKVEANDETGLSRNKLEYYILKKLFPNDIISFGNLSLAQEKFYRQLENLRDSERQSLYYSMRDADDKMYCGIKIRKLFAFRSIQKQLEELFHKQKEPQQETLLEIIRFVTIVQQRLRDSVMYPKELEEEEEAVDIFPFMIEVERFIGRELTRSKGQGGQLMPEKLNKILSDLETLYNTLQEQNF